MRSDSDFEMQSGSMPSHTRLSRNETVGTGSMDWPTGPGESALNSFTTGFEPIPRMGGLSCSSACVIPASNGRELGTASVR